MAKELMSGFFETPLKFELSKLTGFLGFGQRIEDNGKYVLIKQFPYAWFDRLIKRTYGTLKLNKMFEACGLKIFGKTTIKIHKFFLPELVYILSKGGSGRPADLIHAIIMNTWIKDIFAEADPKGDTDMSRITQDMNVKLYDWQTEFIKQYDIKRRRSHLHGELLSFGCGLGKTITALATLKSVGCEKVIVIAPKSTLVDVWVNHLINMKFFKKTPDVYLVGQSDPKNADYFIFNYEAMDKIDDILRFVRDKKLGIIVDESQNFLKLKSQRTQNLIDLREKTKCDHVLMLSGTPVKGVGVECIPILRVLDGFFDDEAVSIFIKALGLSTTIGTDILHSRLSLVMHRRTQDEVFQLPPLTETTIGIKTKDANDYTISNVKKTLEVFMDQRVEFHVKNMPLYRKYWEESLVYWDNSSVGNTRDYLRWKQIVKALIKNGYSRFDRKCMEDVAWANKYEDNVLIPALPDKVMRDNFKLCRSKIKYLNLCIQGEVLGELDRMRARMCRSMMDTFNVEEAVAFAIKKVIFATTYVDVVEYLEKKCSALDLNPICVYGKTSANAPQLLDKFRKDESSKVLICTMQTLATGVTLTEANTVIFCNQPWRESDKIQMQHRVHRIGQDTECFSIELRLDTGSNPNLSDRTAEILDWSKRMADAIVDGKESVRQAREALISTESFKAMPDTPEDQGYCFDVLVIPSEEEFKVRDERIKKIVDSCKKYNASEFAEVIQEGDVIIPYKRKKFVDKGGVGGRIITAINKFLQGSSFTSCKVVGKDAKEIVGYGVLAGKGYISSARIKGFTDQHEAAMICRHVSITPEKAKKVLEVMYKAKEEQTKYDVKSLIASVWHHWFGTKDKAEKDKEFNKTAQSALICSSLVLKAFKESGMNVQHENTVGDKYIWPRDFILSSSFKIVGGYFSKEANVK